MELIVSVEVKLFETKKLKQQQECLHYILAINLVSVHFQIILMAVIVKIFYNDPSWN